MGCTGWLSVMLKWCLVQSRTLPVLKDCSSRGSCWLSHPAKWLARVWQDTAVLLSLQGRWVARRLHLCKMAWVGRNVQIGRVIWAWKKKTKQTVFYNLKTPFNYLRSSMRLLSLTSLRNKHASHHIPTLCATIEGWLFSGGGRHSMLGTIWNRWDLSWWVDCPIRVYPIESKDHSRVLGSCRFLSSYWVVLWRCIGCFGLQKSGRGSAGKAITHFVQATYHLLYCRSLLHILLNGLFKCTMKLFPDYS